MAQGDFTAKVREHSRKPDELYDIVREASAGPRIDVFSPEEREGFDTWGNQAGYFEAARASEGHGSATDPDRWAALLRQTDDAPTLTPPPRPSGPDSHDDEVPEPQAAPPTTTHRDPETGIENALDGVHPGPSTGAAHATAVVACDGRGDACDPTP